MDRKTIKPDYKIMRMILNQCFRLNHNNILFTVLIYVFLYLTSTLLPLTVSSLMMGNSATFGMLIIFLILFVAGMLVSQYLAYGKDVIMARMVEKKHITIGYLFNGFRDKTKRILKASLLFFLISFISGLLCCIVTLPFFASALMTGEGFDMETIQRISSIIGIVGIIFTALASYPFLFTWILIYRMPEASVLECFGLSAKLVFSQFFRIIGFLIYSSWQYIVILALFIPLDYFLAAVGFTKAGMGGSLFAIIFSILEISAEINAFMRISLAVPIYLFSMTGVLQIHKSEYKPPVQETEEIESESKEEKESDEVLEQEEKIESAGENQTQNEEPSSES